MNFSVISFEASQLMSKIITKLSSAGMQYDRCFVVPRGKKEFADALKLAQTADNIIVIGGLGGGSRFFVKDAVAEVFGLRLVKNAKAEENLARFAAAKKKTYVKQQYNSLISYPEGFECYPYAGEESSACLSLGGREIFLLSEESCEYIFDSYVYNRVIKKQTNAAKRFFFKLYGLTAAEIGERAFKRAKGFSFDVTTSGTTDSLAVITFGGRAGAEAVDDAVREFCTVFANEIYADGDVSLEERAVSLLTVRNRIISLAESVTGGLIASKLISVSGASKVINEAFVCYSDRSKIKRLNVSALTLSKHGAVSDETAYEMAVGLLDNGCDLAVATTGIADKGGEASEKPVGLCYTSIGDARGIHIHKDMYFGTRNQVREQIASDALFRIIKHLQKN